MAGRDMTTEDLIVVKGEYYRRIDADGAGGVPSEPPAAEGGPGGRPFAVGDVVRLKSGGLAMTVSDINDELALVRAVWMAPDGAIRAENFTPPILEHAR